AVETLGAVNVICFDKTGTLTRNRMSVVEIFASDASYICDDDVFRVDGRPVRFESEPVLRMLGHISVLCSEAALSRGKSGENEINGSPTRSALIRMAITCGVDPMTLRSEYPLLDTTQRAAGRNWMVTTHKSPDGRIFTAVKGAPAEVAGMCSRQRENEST